MATGEFVILFPVFVVLFMCLVQWGLYFHARNEAIAAAQDATRAAQGVDGTEADGEAVARALLEDSTDSGLLRDVTVDVTRTGGTARTVVHATVQGLVPIPGLELHVEGVSEGPVEQFVPDSDRP